MCWILKFVILWISGFLGRGGPLPSFQTADPNQTFSHPRHCVNENGPSALIPPTHLQWLNGFSLYQILFFFSPSLSLDIVQPTLFSCYSWHGHQGEWEREKERESRRKLRVLPHSHSCVEPLAWTQAMQKLEPVAMTTANIQFKECLSKSKYGTTETAGFFFYTFK